MNKYGFTDKEWNETLSILKKHKEIEKVVLFGSRAKNTFKPMSDVDIVLFGEKISHSIIASLQSDFEDSQIPYMFDVIAYKTITSDELKEHIRIYGKNILGAENNIPSGWVETTLVEVAIINPRESIVKGEVATKIPMACLGNFTKKIQYFEKKSYKSKLMTGTFGIQRVQTNSLIERKIFLPPLPEQKAIANILTSFDNKIELLQAQNKTLETTAQTIFKEWFGNKSDNWKLVKIDNFLDISSSKRIFYNEYIEKGIPFYRSKEIIELSTKPDISTELFISVDRFKEIKDKFSTPKKRDILLTAVGTLGVPFQVRDSKPFFFKDGNLIWFKNFNKTLFSDFVYYWLKLKSTQNQLNIISIGSTQKALTITSVKELEIPFIKNLAKREDFYGYLKSNLDKVNYNHQQIQTLKKTSDTLLPKLMSGQIRVNEFKDKDS